MPLGTVAPSGSDNYARAFRISGKLRNHAAAKILAEIGKCELVCANCHAIRTYNRLYGIAEESAVYTYQLAA